MRLRDYLGQRGETQEDFADRSGISQQTVSKVCNGSACRIDTARRIIQASRQDPAPCGGTVTYEDLVPESAAGAA